MLVVFLSSFSDKVEEVQRPLEPAANPTLVVMMVEQLPLGTPATSVQRIRPAATDIDGNYSTMLPKL